MEKSYWLGRQATSRDRARQAEGIEARCIHTELADRYGVKAALCDQVMGETPGKGFGISSAIDGSSTEHARTGERRWTKQEEVVVQMLLAGGESCGAVALRAHRSQASIGTRQPATLAL